MEEKILNKEETQKEEIQEVEGTKELGLYTIKETFGKEIEEGQAKFYYGSLRSGQKLEYDGNLIIIGDVNGGAEVFATGNIIILGTLRGLAHAGATGNTKATISAMEMKTPQIRIANIIKEMDIEREAKRETARLMENQILLED